jgi:hypothetical protein
MFGDIYQNEDKTNGSDKKDRPRTSLTPNKNAS